MKTNNFKSVLFTIFIISIVSCKKTEAINSGYNSENVSADSTVAISDSISSVATMSIKERQFIKTAEVDMEVEDVYNTTIALEKSIKDLEGFVTKSNLKSNVISEETFNTSDSDAILIKKFQTENQMQTRIPTEKLGKFLQIVNDKKVFLNSRIISAEDVTSNIQYAKMEAERNKKTSQNISKLKTDKDKVSMSDENMKEDNYQKLSEISMTDQIKYSTVNINLKEPKLRIAKITVLNINNIDDQYKYNFLYDSKKAFIEGFYFIQNIIVWLFSVWPIVLIGLAFLYFYRKRKNSSAIYPSKANNNSES